MPQPTLSDLFPGATQDITTVTIPKSALTGLTAIASNNADQIFAGLVARAIDYYTPARRDGDSTAVPAVVGDKDISIIAELGTRSINRDFETSTDYEEQIIDLSFYKTSVGGGLVPNDY
jgi:hypothetical protein